MAVPISIASIRPRSPWRHVRPLVAILALVLAAACSPTVKLETPAEPIRIDLTVKIQQDVQVTLVDGRSAAGERGAEQ